MIMDKNKLRRIAVKVDAVTTELMRIANELMELHPLEFDEGEIENDLKEDKPKCPEFAKAWEAIKSVYDAECEADKAMYHLLDGYGINVGIDRKEQHRLRKEFALLIARVGDNGVLWTWNYCTDNGCELAGSTIDQIELRGQEVYFVYNVNGYDEDALEHFHHDDLQEFLDGLTDAILNG